MSVAGLNNSLFSLPDDVMLQIFSPLDVKSLLGMRQVSKMCRSVDMENIIYRALIERKGGQVREGVSCRSQWELGMRVAQNLKSGLYLPKNIGVVKSDVRTGAISSDGNEFLIATADKGNHERTLRLWNRHTGECTRTYDTQRSIAFCGFNDNNNELLTGSKVIQGRRMDLQLWNKSQESGPPALTLGTMFPLAEHFDETEVTYCTTNSSGTEFLSISRAPDEENERIVLWDMDTRDLVRSFEHRFARFCTFSLDGREILSVSGDAIKLWNKESGECVHTFDVRQVTRAAFSSDGKKIMAVRGRGILIWDKENRRQLGSYHWDSGYWDEDGHCLKEKPDRDFIACAFSQDNNALLGLTKQGILETLNISVSESAVLSYVAEGFSKHIWESVYGSRLGHVFEKLPSYVKNLVYFNLYLMVRPEGRQVTEDFGERAFRDGYSSPKAQKLEAMYRVLRTTLLISCKLDFEAQLPLQEVLERFQVLPMAIRGPIYEQMYVMKRPAEGPTAPNFGEEAFNTGSTATEKAEAIGRYLLFVKLTSIKSDLEKARPSFSAQDASAEEREAMRLFQTLPQEVKAKVYYEMYVIKRPAGQNTPDKFGETVFHNGSTCREKAQAISRTLSVLN